MVVVNERNEIITAYDLKKGRLVPCVIISPAATPLDGTNKKAWATDDYINAMRYVPHPPTISLPTIEERVSDIELAIAEIYGGKL